MDLFWNIQKEIDVQCLQPLQFFACESKLNVVKLRMCQEKQRYLLKRLALLHGASLFIQ